MENILQGGKRISFLLKKYEEEEKTSVEKSVCLALSLTHSNPPLTPTNKGKQFSMKHVFI